MLLAVGHRAPVTPRVSSFFRTVGISSTTKMVKPAAEHWSINLDNTGFLCLSVFLDFIGFLGSTVV